MTATTMSLWPDDIKVDVLPPLIILKSQAAKLRELTAGILTGEVVTSTGHDDFVVHRLEIVAPQLGGRRYGVLTVTHRASFYPVVLEADCFRPRETRMSRVAAATVEVLIASMETEWPSKNDWRPAASDQDEFVKRVGEVLKSPSVRSVIDSLLALSNEKNQPAEAESAA